MQNVLAVQCSARQWKLNKHAIFVSKYLSAVAKGGIKRLMILEPPGHGKTVQISQWFPAWYLGLHPDHILQLVSYGKDLARDSSEIARELMREHGPAYFDVSLDRRRTAATRWHLAGHSGGLRAVGIGGSLTGRHPHGIIADDLVKDASAAMSKVQREAAWKWWQSTLSTRLMPDGWIIVTGYRWHNDDLLGRILADGDKRGQPWTVVRLPALAEENDLLKREVGEPLWPSKYGRSKSF